MIFILKFKVKIRGGPLHNNFVETDKILFRFLKKVTNSNIAMSSSTRFIYAYGFLKGKHTIFILKFKVKIKGGLKPLKKI